MATAVTDHAFAIQGSQTLEPFGLSAMTQRIFSATKLPILVIRIDAGAVIYANPTACDAFGLADQQRALSIWDIVVDSPDRDILMTQLKRRSEGYNDDYELMFRRLDNKRGVIARIAGVALTDEPGELVASLNPALNSTESEICG